MEKLLKWWVLAVAASIVHIASSATTDDVVIDDMVLTKEQYDQHFVEPSIGRNGVVPTRLKTYRWPDNTVPIVWDIFMNQEGRRKFMEKAKIISDNSCIKFLYKFDVKKYPNHVFVRNDTYHQCKSRVGFHNMGRQILEWSPRCTVLHELLHVLGFFHMHQTATRDDYVKINYENIIPHYKKSFDKLVTVKTSLYDTPYDYLSILHYDQYAFSKEWKKAKTIIPLKGDKNTAELMGQRFSWSAGDKKRLNNMYKCPPQNG